MVNSVQDRYDCILSDKMTWQQIALGYLQTALLVPKCTQKMFALHEHEKCATNIWKPLKTSQAELSDK